MTRPAATTEPRGTRDQSPAEGTYELVVVANRLPVDRVTDDDGTVRWQQSPGGLVTAMQSVMTGQDGAWVGWSGDPGEAPEPFDSGDMHLHAVGLTEQEIEDHYEGFSNETLWPLYHDVIVPPRFRRRWFDGYRTVNRRFAEVAASLAAPGATVWVHDYQLQLVPAMLRELRPDVRIGWFNHIPFPGVEIFAQLPWRKHIVQGLLGADLLGFQRRADADNFLRVCRRLLGLHTRGGTVEVAGPHGSQRVVRASAFPISIDAASLAELARTPEVMERAKPDPARPRRPRARAARHRPARLHQGHPAPAQGLRGAAVRRRARPARDRARAGRHAQPRAGVRVHPAARAGRGHRGSGQRRLRRTSACRPSTTCTSPTGGPRWRRCSWPPT